MDAFVAPVAHHSVVYKEECVLCFQSVRHPGGIFTCLKCFNAGCKQHAEEHAAAHKDHVLAVNIVSVLEVKPGGKVAEEPAQKLTKLAIGVEGGAQLDSNKLWRTESRVVRFPGAEEVSEPSPKVAETVKLLLAATDMGAKADAQAWEEKRTECEHTLTLQQGAPVARLPSCCSEPGCGLTKPLWLCLTCGNLGCGRPISMGNANIGGNGHAMAHRHKNSDHVLVAKIGTFTPDGQGDVYCYACDNDVSAEMLPRYLANFGIDTGAAVKTEMSMAELSLEQNKLLDVLSKEDNQSLEPVFGPGFTGLRNIGNTCYLNSVVQMLFSLPEWRREFQQDVWERHRRDCREREPAKCWQCQTGKLAGGLWSGNYSLEGDQERNGIAPRMWKQFLTKGSLFEGVQQQDAYEFFQYVLKKTTEHQRRTGGTNLADVFSFDVAQRVQCTNCGGCRYSYERGTDVLSLGIPLEDAVPPVAEAPKGEKAAERMTRHYQSKVPFRACVSSFAALEHVPGFFCSKCQSAQVAAKSQSLATFPPVLVAQMRRFTFENYLPQKLSVQVSGLEDSRVIDLSHLQTPEANPNEVVLVDPKEQKQEDERADPGIVANLEAMGFGKVQCERAAFETKNVGVEEAMNYLLAHMDDGSLDKPLKRAAKAAPVSFAADLIEQLTSMGFSAGQAKQALRECQGSVERAVDWLFSHPDATGDDDVPAPAASAAPAAAPSEPRGKKLYELIGFILHKGNQIGSGHYVAYLWSEEKKSWIVYDDERVSFSLKPPVEQAYMYFFRKMQA